MYGPTAVYVAPNPGAPAVGPFVAPADVLLTEGRYRSRQSAEETDPFAAVYEAQVDFKQKGPWAVLAVTKDGGKYVAAPSQVQVITKKTDTIPEVGAARRASPPTRSPRSRATRSCSTRACRRATCTRSRSTRCSARSRSRCCSRRRSCASHASAARSPMRPAAQGQVRRQDRVHPPRGLQGQQRERRPAAAAGGVPPAHGAVVFVINKDGKITARLEGSFGSTAFENALKTAL